MEEVQWAIFHRLSESMMNELAQPFTKEEVTQALIQMHPCKAPGPDSMSAIFF